MPLDRVINTWSADDLLQWAGASTVTDSLAAMSKKTKKKKAKMRRSKANHGKRPNMGRG